MKHIRKIVLIVLSLVMALAVGVFFIGCDKDELLTPTKTLTAPTQVRVEGNNLCWNPVEFAVKYTVSIDNREYFCEDTMYPLPTMTDGVHVFKVKANGDGSLYESSSWSEGLTVTYEEGGTTRNDYYGQFDELTKKESFLGYGFDVIKSSVFSDKYVKTSFPIFKTDELMNQRLLKVDSKQSYVEEVQSKDMETFMASWNANANVNVSWGGKRVGGSVDVSARYSGGVENAKSKYFHVISFYNQKFYIVLQSDLNTYKTIISDSFKQDLYSDMEPATFFDRYGTHFITSAVMGGKINSYYLYSSEEEKSYHDISGKVSTEVRMFKTGVNVDLSGGYKNEASAQNIFIKNTLEVIGGGDFGMLSDADIPANYKDWEKSLDEHASLMGIKDTGSLIPLWELIDSSLDTRTYSWEDDNGQVVSGNRSQQLQAYFMRYGMDEYNELMKNAGLPEIVVPESIENVRINGVLESNGEFEVYAGTDNDIAFSVLPEQAVGYTKNASLTDPCEYARIINDNGLKLQIDANIPRDIKVYNLVISAGSIRKQITVRVIKTYTVDFNSSPGTSVPSLRNVKDGDRILEPTPPVLEDYEFKGWYTSDNFEENTKFDFVTNTITKNLTLYARWAVYFPKIRFVHEVPGCELVEDTVQSGTSYNEPEIPTVDGYIFGGWYSDIEMVTPFDFTQKIKKETYIYVKWYKNPTITFVHSVDGCTMLKDSVVYNGVYSQPIMPEVEGYSFGGYYANEEMTQAYDFTKNITKDQTIYVKWNKDVAVNFVSNIDNEVISQTTVKYNTAVSKPDQDPKIEGYDFKGYYKDAKLTQVYDFNTKLTYDTEIYVKYDIKSFTVKFNTNGGTVVADQKIEYNSKATEPTVTKTGSSLEGWYFDSDFTKFFNFSVDVITDNITLYAKWGEKLYSVSFEVNGGTAIDSVNVTENTAIGNKLPTTAFKTGHTFDGWYLEQEYKTKVTSETVITKAITIYVKWKINEYTVSGTSVNGKVYWSTSQITTSGGSASLKANYDSTVYWRIEANTGYTRPQTYYGQLVLNGSNFTANHTSLTATKAFTTCAVNTYTVSGTSANGKVYWSTSQITTSGGTASLKANYDSTVYWRIEANTGYTRPQAYYGQLVVNGSNFTANHTSLSATKAFTACTANTYTLNYNINAPTYALSSEKSQSVASTTWKYGTTMTLTTKTVAFTGYKFKGWATSANSTTVLSGGNVSVNLSQANIQLYAVWEIDPYTIGKANVTNGTRVSDVFGNSYFVFNDIHNTPSITKALEDNLVYPAFREVAWEDWKDIKVVADWSSYTSVNNYANYRDIIGDRVNQSNSGYINWNFSILTGVSDIYFIGNPTIEYRELYIFTVGYEVNQKLTMHFKDMYIVADCRADEAIIDAWYGSEHKDVGMDLVLDFHGNNKFIAAHAYSGTPIGMHKNVTITGDGYLEIKGSDGAAATTAGTAGGNGGAGIKAENLTINYNGTIKVTGGNGGNGANGNDGGTNVAGTNGGNGGNGGNAVSVDELLIKTNATITLIGGNGGNGGNGGKGGDGRGSTQDGDRTDGKKGGNGGNGGNAGFGITTSNITSNVATVSLTANSGNGGKGGNGGNGGKGGWNDWWLGACNGASGGNGGDGGKGGNSYAYNITVNGATSAHGSAGAGGNYGIGGEKGDVKSSPVNNPHDGYPGNCLGNGSAGFIE
ncbi:MAG: InlB B-repeat-containing protein [Clostridia bacterium]|nr:InlB B-repeat-containing protein [Clostridia bacterium]